MRYNFVVLFFSIFLNVFPENSKNEIIQIRISTGKIEGYIDRRKGSSVKVFKGIPFAEPPVGDLRFSLPKEKSPWHFTWDAKRYRPACMTNTTMATKTQKNISENCLYINIFADSRCTENETCPVIYYIHGGAFFWGSAVQFTDDFIIERYASDRMVFVIPAYRLGVFGFWDLGDDETVPRNLGLHGMLFHHYSNLDIILSLKWIQEEIYYFGGDSRHVTLMGNSAGASAIQFLSVSPAVPSLYYDKAIISSGTPTIYNGFKPSATESVIRLSQCRSNASIPTKEIMKCLRKVDAFKILDLAQIVESEDDIFFDVIVVDWPLFHNKTFTELLDQWKPVPLFIGATKNEMPDHYLNVTLLCQKYGSMFDYTGNHTIKACVEKYDHLVPKLKNRQLVVDSTHAEVYREALVNTKNGKPSYVWEFTMNGHNWHAGDITFMIGSHRPKNLSEEEKVIDRFYEDAIKNFIRTGDPKISGWIAFDTEGENYMVFDCKIIDKRVFTPYPLRQKYYPQAERFWLNDLAKIESGEKVSDKTKLLQDTLAIERVPKDELDYSRLILSISIIGIIINIFVVINNCKDRDVGLDERISLLSSNNNKRYL